MKITSCVTLWFILHSLILQLSYPVDKSGVSPNVVSLPKGPGSIEGLGSEYQPQLNTGTASYSVILTLPPGVNGHQPELSVKYEGGNGNGPLGIGWSLQTPSIRRQCEKGIPRYEPNGFDDNFDGEVDDPDEDDVFLDPKGEELVLTGKGYYFPENQEQFIRWYRIDDHWEGRKPDGSLMELGLTPAGRVADGDRVFAWLLERETDTLGNVIEYRYAEYAGSDRQKYLREVRYGPGAPPWDTFYLVVLTHEERLDVFDDYRSGFLVRTGHRIARVDIALQGSLPTDGHLIGDANSDGVPDALIRRYEMRYETHPHWSFLSRVIQLGADGESALPPAVFGYELKEPETVVSAMNAVIGGFNEPPRVMDNPLVELVDLNADGLPDMLYTDQGSGSHIAYLNEGIVDLDGRISLRWGAAAEVDSRENDHRAWLFALENNAVSLADMNGDGLSDLVINPPQDPTPRYFLNRGKIAWGPLEWMAVGDEVPPAPFGDDKVRILDIDFDKNADIVKSIPDGYQIWYNLGQDLSGLNRYSRMVLRAGAHHEGEVLQFTELGLQLADMNGDRIVDVARIQPDRVIWYPNTGYGRFEQRVSMMIPPDDGYGHDGGFDVLSEDVGQITRARLADITGDGLSDLVVERAVSQEVWYWINLGNRTFSSRHIVKDLPANFSAQVTTRWADLNGNGTTDLIYADSQLDEGERLRMVDLGVLINGTAHPNLLTRIENGIGKTILIEYRPSTEYAIADSKAGRTWKYSMPNPSNLISRFTMLDGLGNEYVTELTYHDGYYDGVEKEFRGFGEAEQKEIGDEYQPTLVTRYTFDTGAVEESLKGKPLRVSFQTEDGKIFTEEEYTLVARRLFSLDQESRNPLKPAGVTFPYLTRTVKITREEPGGETEPVYSEKEYVYDDYGNLVKEANYGRIDGVDRNFGDDERILWAIYSASDSSPIWNLPVETVTTDNASPPVIAAHSLFYYDGPPFQGLALGELEFGNLTRRRDWVGPTDAMSSIEAGRLPPPRFLSVAENPDHTLSFQVLDESNNELDRTADQWIDKVRNQFDSYGNTVVAADPLAVVQNSVPNPITGHFRTYSYDPLLKIFPTEERIFISDDRSIAMRTEFDIAFGVVTRSLDFNGNPTLYGYDTFARIVKIVKPGGSIPDTLDMPTTSYDYQLAQPFATAGGGPGVINWIETRTHETYGDPDAYFITRAFVDGIGRTVMTKEEDEDPNRVVVKQSALFGNRKKPYRFFQPFYSSRGFEFEDPAAPGWTGVWSIDGEHRELGADESPHIDYYYDATGREIKKVQPDDSFSQIVHAPYKTIYYDGEKTNPASKHFDVPLIHFHDGLGRLVGVDEVVRLDDSGNPAGSPSAWRTGYRYDLLDNAIQMTDSQNNVKILNYDGIKRRRFMDDPDRGRILYAYDDASNLIETRDAKGQRVTYTYDGVNRLLTEDYHDADFSYSAGRNYDPQLPISESNRPDVAYFYDEPAGPIDLGNGETVTANNTRGYLSYVIDLSGEEHTSYDERSRVAWEVKRIPDPRNFIPVSYKTETAYDAMDRMISILYPDGDRTVYQYNARALVEKITGGSTTGIIDRIDYEPSQKIDKCEYGNGVHTEFAYDIRDRMNGLKTFLSSEPDAAIVHYSYAYDYANNITRIDDLRPAAVIPGGDKLRDTQIFDYDNLYRLTQVRYSFALPGEADRDDGRIDYRYDRIGNLLAQSSTIAHSVNGRSVTNLGTLSYGNTQSSSDEQNASSVSPSAGNSIGRGLRPRAESSAPGPHALTEATNGLDSRSFRYDENGNMAEYNGLRCAWDFKDRLIAMENDLVLIRYAYDYTDRRVSKSVWRKTGGELEPVPSTSIVYVNKFFEIREHDQTVKYIFQGNSRVAQITGTLDTSAQRIQRQRLHAGWNLVSLAVDSPNAARRIGIGVDPHILEAYRWNQENEEFVPISADEPLPAGAVLWIRTDADGMLVVQGEYQELAPVTVPAGGRFMVPHGFVAFTFDKLMLPDTVRAWIYDTITSSWFFHAGGELSFLSNMPGILNPAQPLYIETPDELTVTLPPANDRIRYYHQNHLGSTVAVTDAEGQVIERAVYYPYGYPRHQQANQEGIVDSSYLFSQKELDVESGLMYFEMRFYAGDLGRFISVDPLLCYTDVNRFPNPQSMNLYAYVNCNPLKYIDPTGEKIVVSGDEAYRKKVQEALKKIDPSASVDLKTGVVSYDKTIDVKGHEKGNKLITRMVDSKHTVTIKTTSDGNEAGADNRDDAADPKKGSGGTVWWNPSGSTTVLTKTKEGKFENKGRPTYIGLGHELIHNDHYQRGVYTKSSDKVDYKGLDDKTYKARVEEIRTVGLGGHNNAADVTENDLRREGGLELRAAY